MKVLIMHINSLNWLIPYSILFLNLWIVEPSFLSILNNQLPYTISNNTNAIQNELNKIKTKLVIMSFILTIITSCNKKEKKEKDIYIIILIQNLIFLPIKNSFFILELF